jgi:hypothetical protein
MPPRIRLFFCGLNLALLFLAAVPLYREFSRRSDIWWTPFGMLVPLAESKDRVEIYARGKPLATLVQGGQLSIAEDGAMRTLATSDVGLRFNNYDRVRAQRLPLLLTNAAACGAIAIMLLLVLTGRLRYREERERPSAS